VSLESIFAGFPERLPPGVTFGDPSKVNDTAKPPRITWYPKRANHLAPRGLGGRDTSPMNDRQWTIFVEIWGESLTGAEQLTNDFLAVAQDLLSKHSYSNSTEDWDVGGVTSKGVLCLLSFQLRTPILKTVIPTVPVTGFEPTFVMGETQV
jgi:hypothetical protein